MLNYHEVELREQDRWLPIANVLRLMKNTLPSTAKVSKDAKECMQECVSEFISFVTSEASDKCLNEKRKTINGEDILYSIHSLGFENYAEVLKIYLAKYREQQALKQERGETGSKKRYVSKKKQELLDNELLESELNGGSSQIDTTSGNNSNEQFISNYINDNDNDNDENNTRSDSKIAEEEEYIANEEPDAETVEVKPLEETGASPSEDLNIKQEGDFNGLGFVNPTGTDDSILYQYGNGF